MERVILHSDLNNFYASVACLYHPQLRNKPVAVGGDSEKRHGIILAKNDIAKKYGIQTGEALWQARQKCHDIVFVPPDFELYLEFSRAAREIYMQYTDKVEAFGLDECWLDVTGSTNLFGDGRKIADEIRRKIKFELGVTASVGVSYNKIFAKLGSDMKKPDATTVISQNDVKRKVWPLPAGELLYVGSATKRKLYGMGIRTIGDLANTDAGLLREKFGKIGYMLWIFANGRDISPVENILAEEQIKSVGNSTTAPRDLKTDADVKIVLYLLCESVAARLREHHFKCSTIQISLRDNRLISFERQGKLAVESNVSDMLFHRAFRLYQENRPHYPIRSVGVRACQLVQDTMQQESFLPEMIWMKKKYEIEKAVDSIRSRFGYFSVRRGIMLTDEQLSNLDAKSDHVIHPVSFLR